MFREQDHAPILCEYTVYDKPNIVSSQQFSCIFFVIFNNKDGWLPIRLQ